MLVLTRTPGQSVTIDGGIVVTVIEIRKCGSIRLGFEAPREVNIRRTEVADNRSVQKKEKGDAV